MTACWCGRVAIVAVDVAMVRPAAQQYVMRTNKMAKTPRWFGVKHCTGPRQLVAAAVRTNSTHAT